MALLSDGQRLETTLDKPGLKVSEFTEYGTRVGGAASNSSDDAAVKTRSTAQLFASSDPVFRAELGWRFGLALAALNFVVLGLAVASANPRAARSTSLVFALFAFVVYYNLMTFGQNWVGAGRLSLGAFMVALHGGTLALAMLLLVARHNRWSPRLPSLRARRPA